MKEQLITFETAKLAKEKGFDIPTIQFYTSGKKAYLSEAEDYMTERYAESNWNNGRGSYPTEPEKVSCSAPTQSLLQKWLREIHDIHISLNYEVPNYSCTIGGYDQNKDEHTCIELYSWMPYEEALEKGLQEALKLIEL